MCFSANQHLEAESCSSQTYSSPLRGTMTSLSPISFDYCKALHRINSAQSKPNRCICGSSNSICWNLHIDNTVAIRQVSLVPRSREKRKSNVAMFCLVFLIQQRNRFKALKSKQISLVPPPTTSCKFTLGIHHSRPESHSNASLVNIPQDSRIIKHLSCTFLCVRKYKKDVISPGEDRYTNNYNGAEQDKGEMNMM